MLAEFTAALSGLNAVAETAKSLINLRDAAMIQGKAAELAGQVMTAYQSATAAYQTQLALLEEVRALKEKVRSLEAREAQKQRYELKDFGGNTFAYALKPEMSNSEPPHRACANCYQQGHVSILQYKYQASSSRHAYHCPRCAKDFTFGEREEPPMDDDDARPSYF